MDNKDAFSFSFFKKCANITLILLSTCLAATPYDETDRGDMSKTGAFLARFWTNEGGASVAEYVVMSVKQGHTTETDIHLVRSMPSARLSVLGAWLRVIHTYSDRQFHSDV